MNCIGDAGVGPGPGYALEEMGQVWHLFRYDVKRSWPLLAGWLAFLLVTFVRELRDPLQRIDAQVSPMEWLHWESAVAWLAIAAGTGMLFVSDTTVGSRSFWKTRPIVRWAMLAAKLLYAAVFFLLIPLVLNCIWALRFGMGPLEWIWIGAQQALMTAALFLPLAAVASLVRTFVMFLVAVFVAWIATLGILLAAMSYWYPADGAAWLVATEPEAVIALSLPLAVAVVAALAVLLIQYLRQNRRLAVAVAVCGCLLGIASIRWARPLAAAVAPNTRQPEFGLSAEILPAIHVDEGFWGYQQPSHVRIPTRFLVDGLDPDQILYDIQLKARLAFSGSKATELSWSFGGEIAYSEPGLAGMNSFPLRSTSTTNLNLYDEPYPAPPDRVGTIRGTVEAGVGRIRKLGSMPLEPGASIDAGAVRIVLEAGELTQTLVTVSVLSRSMGRPAGLEPQVVLLVVNPERAEHLTAPVVVSGSAGLLSFRAYVFGEPMLLTQRNEKKFGLRYPADEGIVSATPAWFENAELQVFSVEPVGQVAIPVEVEEFRLRMYRR